MPLVKGIALSLVTVLLVVVAFALGIWPAIWVAFVPMLVAQHRVLPARWSGLGPAIGIGGMFGFHLSPGLVDGGLPALAVLWPVLMAAVIAPLFWRSRRFHEATGYRWFLVSAPVAWAALDFLRTIGNAVLAATFGDPAYAMWRHPALLQPLSVFGIAGLELLILLTNWALAGGVIALIDRRRSRASAGAGADEHPAFAPRRAFSGLAIAGVATAAWMFGSVAMLAHPRPTVTVAAVQTGVDRDAVGSQVRLDRDIAQTRMAAAQGAQLVVWNEKGLAFDPRTQHTAELQALARETGVQLVIGFGYTDGKGRHHNEVTLLTPHGRFLGVYGKDHPGTFAGDYSDTGGTYPVYRRPSGRSAPSSATTSTSPTPPATWPAEAPASWPPPPRTCRPSAPCTSRTWCSVPSRTAWRWSRRTTSSTRRSSIPTAGSSARSTRRRAVCRRPWSAPCPSGRGTRRGCPSGTGWAGSAWPGPSGLVGLAARTRRRVRAGARARGR